MGATIATAKPLEPLIRQLMNRSKQASGEQISGEQEANGQPATGEKATDELATGTRSNR